ncbi:hypothetical protein ACH40F_52510 [Streptomyces sp. NPDC020794]|uniref:hypothetical protein n=1 Tax=unclassified Streptomyces TaxID=2593676 RepID=UPI0036ED1814
MVSTHLPGTAESWTKTTFLSTSNTELPAQVKRYLGEAIVRYERAGRCELTKRYGSKTAVDHLSWSGPRGR